MQQRFLPVIHCNADVTLVKRVSLPVLKDTRPSRAAPRLPRARLGTLHLDEGPGAAEVRRALDVLLHGLRAYRIGGAPFVFSLRALPALEAGRLLHALGEGDVAITLRGPPAVSIRETALQGLWRVGGELLVVADVPAAVRDADATREILLPGAPAAPLPSVRPVLEDLSLRARAWRRGDANHVVSLAQLSLDDEALDDLDERLGRGPVVAESTGLGRCRVALTAHRHIWTVQHRNGLGELLVDALEIGDVPAALAAAHEDLADSADRLASLLAGRG